MVGERIRTLRKRLGMTQEALAGEDLTKSYISQVELGRIHPSPKALELIAERLGKPMGYFLESHEDFRTIEVLLRAAYALWSAGNLDDSLVGLHEAMALVQRTGRDDILAGIFITAGRIEVHRGRLDAALVRFGEALRLAESQDHIATALDAAASLGTVSDRLGDFTGAISAFATAAGLLKAPSRSAPEVWVGAYQAYGDFCFRHLEWGPARALYEAALDVQPVSPQHHADALHRLAWCHWFQGEAPDAASRLVAAEALHAEFRDPQELSALWANAAHLWLVLGQPENSRQALTRAHALLTQIPGFSEAGALASAALLFEAYQQQNAEAVALATNYLREQPFQTPAWQHARRLAKAWEEPGAESRELHPLPPLLFRQPIRPAVPLPIRELSAS